MYAKVKITGKLEVVTGLHIGGSDAFSAIGAVDSPVIKDALSGYPLIPGSSLKGKLRTLLARSYSPSAQKPEDDSQELLRLFGSSKKDKSKVGRLIFSDMVLSNWQDLQKRGAISKTEVKFENTINRLTAIANPRQIERVIKGSVFHLDLVYEVDNAGEMEEDFKVLAEGLKILQYDYLGGHGTRGYGKVKFHDLTVEKAIGDVESGLLAKCQTILAEV